MEFMEIMKLKRFYTAEVYICGGSGRRFDFGSRNRTYSVRVLRFLIEVILNSINNNFNLQYLLNFY